MLHLYKLTTLFIQLDDKDYTINIQYCKKMKTFE